MSKRWVSGMALMVCTAAVASAGTIEGNLERLLSTTSADDTVSVLVYLADAVDVLQLDNFMEAAQMPMQERHALVIHQLQDRANASQAPVFAALKQLQLAGEVKSFEAFWISNMFRVDAKPAAIRQLAARADVHTVYVNYPVERVAEVATQPAPGGTDTPEPGLVAINVPQVWAMGIDGSGVLVATLDTGVDGTHPAVASRWAGTLPQYAGHPGWAWKVASGVGGDPNHPTDTYGHGTHTMGTVCGGAPGDQVGVAPGAHWISDNAINQGVGGVFNSDVIAAFQWMADPDGDPNTNWDVPVSCSNSWGLTTSLGMQPCDPLYWSYLDACEAAGIVIIFSAGNEGPGANTLRRPADRAIDDFHTLAVAAVDANTQGWPIADFSSRGPTYCDPNQQARTKPNISGPGVNVRSSWPGGSYQLLSGTSMASPHINGTVALMKQACPNLSVQQTKQILYQTAHDLGAAGEDSNYGWGMVDAYAAVLGALQVCGQTRYGACCNDSTGVCQDNVAALDCFAQHGRFADGTLCANLNPTCEAHGACCTANGCLSNIGENECVAQGGRFAGANSTCPQLIYVQTTGGAFEDIHSTGTEATAAETDDGGAAYPLGFTFYFYNNAQTTVGISSNGYLTFGSVYNVYIPSAIPHASDPTSQIAALWRDLNETGLPRSVVYQTLGTAPNRRFIAQWTNAPCYSGCGNSTFQIALYETTNKVEFRYQGVLATGYVAGVENSDGSVGTDVTAAVQPNSSLGLVPQPSGPDPCAGCRGDLNCDGQINFDDINPFVAVLSGATPCNAFNADINGDGHINFDDINPFVDLLANHSGPCH